MKKNYPLASWSEQRRSSLLFFMLLLLSGLGSAFAQSGVVVGITGHQLVQVNLEDGGLTPFRQLKGLPAGTKLRNLVFIPQDTAFYSIMNFNQRPELIKIRATGSWQRMGVFHTEQQDVFFCEGLTYDEANDRLYLAASLDGPIQTDKKSEALLIVDREDAGCTLAATLRQDIAPDDFDAIAMFDNKLFGFDGVPHSTTYIYPFSPAQFDGRELFAGTKQNIPYFTMNDVVVIGQFLYFPHSITRGWYYFDLRARRWQQAGTVHGPASLGRIKLTGLAYYPIAQA